MRSRGGAASIQRPEPLRLARPCAAGKFLYADQHKLYIRGVTYGTFGGVDSVPAPNLVAADFAAMAAAGINTVRVYTVPPRWLLDLAAQRGLRVLVGVPWEQHVTFLDEPDRRRSIESRVRHAVRSCAGHPAVLGYLIGNEIPATIVRWHGRHRVERFIERLYRAAKAEDPDALVSYANFPSTEYLQLPFLDFVCFNVFLEDERRLAGYLARLQTIAGDRPLVISELGLDSRRHGVERQADSVGAQVRAAYGAGCAGCFVFSWTDEWQRGGYDVEDWDFGLVDRARERKPALGEVSAAFAQVPFGQDSLDPRVSVIVCTYNGASTISECVQALAELDYPDYEVIVVDDGSTDGTGELAALHGARVIQTENEGLSSARNTGIAAATGEVIAFCDDDCRPDPHWLRYLASVLTSSAHAGVGGPNIPPHDVLVADSVGHAPGGPMHVLLSESEAEHIPGCNMAFWRGELERVGGFDPQFRVAGDDVDVCWRIQQAGGTLGFSPGALVWHRARRSVRAYLRQQIGYGRAEALLERKWPERYNGAGHVSWAGMVYGGKVRRSFGRRRWLVYYGHAGSGLFQSVYDRGAGGGSTFPLAPEWYLLLVALAAASMSGVAGAPLPLTVPLLRLPVAPLLLVACLALMSLKAALWACAVVLPCSASRRRRASTRALIFALCLLQPLARLWGRAQLGLTPWRFRGRVVLAAPFAGSASVWSERWRASDEWVALLDSLLREGGAQVAVGGDFDTWDLEVRVGALASARMVAAVEEHGQGRQLLRVRFWPRCGRGPLLLGASLAAVTAAAAVQGFAAVALAFAVPTLWLAGWILVQAGAAVALPAAVAASLQHQQREPLRVSRTPATWTLSVIHTDAVVAMTAPEHEPWKERP